MKKLIALSFFIFFAACGIKGPPLPPIDENAVRKQKNESVTVATPTMPATASSDSTSGQQKDAKNKKKTKQ